jgi:hypothetical protein
LLPTSVDARVELGVTERWMQRPRKLAIAIVLGVALGGTAQAAEPLGSPPPSSRVAPRPAREFRFDALRIDGALRGPEALVISAGLHGGRTPLHRRGRSFLHRIFETIEAPGLVGR